MQTVVPSHLQFKGKLEDKVFVDSATYGYHWRKRPKSAKATLRVLKAQNKRAAFINKLASELNSIIRIHTSNFKSSNFYHRLLKKFRRESIDNRYLLLKQVEKMRINEKFPEKTLGYYDFDVKQSAKEIVVDINTTRHFTIAYAGETSCYYYEVLLITWANNKQDPRHSRQGSGWIEVPGELKKCTFTFSLPNPASQWLLCIGYRSGKNNVLDPTHPSRNMEVIKAGTFEKKDLELLKSSKPYIPKSQRKNLAPVQEIETWVTPMSYLPQSSQSSRPEPPTNTEIG